MNVFARYARRMLLVTACVAYLSGCSGGSSNPGPSPIVNPSQPVPSPSSTATIPKTTPTATPPAMPTATASAMASAPASATPVLTAGAATFTIRINPKTPKGPTGRHRQYLSPDTESVQIFTDSATTGTIVNLTTIYDAPTNTSPNCTLSSTVLLCTVAINVPLGPHVFTLTTYDQLNAMGNILSTNTTGTVTVTSSGVTVPIVLEGIVAYVYLSLGVTTPPVGYPATIPVNAFLEDADHNMIIGSADFENPVTLTSSDTTNGPLSTTQINSPADLANLSIAYSGANVASITYSATANGLATNNVQSAVLTPITGGATSVTVPCSGGTTAPDFISRKRRFDASSSTTPVLVQEATGTDSATFAQAPAVGDTVVVLISDFSGYANPSFGTQLPFENYYNYPYAQDVTSSSDATSATTITTGDPGNTLIWIGEFSGTSAAVIAQATGGYGEYGYEGYATASIVPNAPGGLVIAALETIGSAQAAPVPGYTDYFVTAQTTNYVLSQDTELANSGTTDTTDPVSLSFCDSNTEPLSVIFQIPPASFQASDQARTRAAAAMRTLLTRDQVLKMKAARKLKSGRE